MSSPSPDLPSFHYGPPPWQRADSSVDSEEYGENESSLEHLNSTGEDYDGIDLDDSSLPSVTSAAGLVVVLPTTKPSPQLSLMRRGSQDSITGGLRVNKPTPATPRIVQHPLCLPPLGSTPAASHFTDSTNVFLGSVKHGRPLEAMCVDPLDRKKRKVNGGSEVSRFRLDFSEVTLIGKGSFSEVFRAKNKVDGQYYAIKRLKRQCTGDEDKRRCEREATILAMLAQCADEDPMLACHIIRYFGSWFEEGRLFLQVEHCQSNLSDYIISVRGGLPRSPMPTGVVVNVLRDISLGLKYLHGMNLVHLDVKPANIFLSSANLFKLGDLGLVSPAGEPTDVCSGDARYLPREILMNHFNHLKKADVFSLGATALECMLGERLEAEGEEWHRLRDGYLPVEDLVQYPPVLVELVTLMMAPDPEKRPTCDDILRHAAITDFCPPRRIRSVHANLADDLSPVSSSTAAKVSSPAKAIIRTLQHTRQKLRNLFSTA